MTPADLRSKLQTIVVVMMENRSFDHVLGHLRHPLYGDRSDVEGIADLAHQDYTNDNGDGVGVPPFWMSDGSFQSDFPHDKNAVAKQLAYSEVTGSFLMNGFVRAFEDEFHTSIDAPAVMGLLRPSDLPTTSALAGQYTVCDHWFACVPTSTAPNRLMSMCGYTDIDETGILLPEQETVYDWLLSHGVSWRVYSAGIPFLALMPRLAPLLLTSHFRRLSALQADVQSADPWPQVVFIEPDYYDCPVHFQPPCDNHPPLGMAAGEAFLAHVYQSLRSNPARWGGTAMFVTYDEHGGFFDHVPPLPVKYRNPNGVSFDSTGPRVPTIVAGPFAKRGVSKVPLDNTSILRLLAERFGRAGEAYSSVVASRASIIASASEVLFADADNTALAPVKPSITPVATEALPAPANCGIHAGFDAAAQNLVDRHPLEATSKYPELSTYLRR